MAKQINRLHHVWDQSTDIITSRDVIADPKRLDDIMAGIFCAGPFYYYIVDFHDRQIKYMTASIQNVLGFEPAAVSFDDIIASIHPEDMQYVAKAEDRVLRHLYEQIGRDKVMDYKMSYCFRMKGKQGDYRLFQHQAIILSTDEKGGFAQSLNIHTDISHLCTQNSFQATLMSIKGKPDFVQFSLKDELKPAHNFTARELEIVRMLAKGMNTSQIAAMLDISPYTVKIHRKNILRKSDAQNTTELIAQCIQLGLL
jgi:DNA-binding CsgD family transcriptional regulator